LDDILEDDFEEYRVTDIVISDQVPALYEKMMEKRDARPGPKIKLTPERYSAIIKYVAAGTPEKYAASAVGIKKETLDKWIKMGEEDPESLYGVFVDDLQRARSQVIRLNVALIQRAAKDDWKASKYLLECTDSDIFSEKKQIKAEVTHTDETQNTFILASDELLKMLAIEKNIEENNEVIDIKYSITDEEEGEEDDPDPYDS
jgi:hypothetical protein